MFEPLIPLFSNPAIRAGLFFAFGLCIGSFMTAFTYRIPRHIDWVREPSRCTSCRARLTALDLVPVFSWLVMRGKCRHCGTKIPARYPLMELACGLVFGLIGWLAF